VNLRPYQKTAIEKVEEAFTRGANRVLIIASVGAGKTIISAELMGKRAKKKRKCLFLAHREELLTQTVLKLKNVHPEVTAAVEQGSQHAGPENDVMVASIQSLQNGMEKKISNFCRPEDLDLCIIDECHHAASPSYLKAIEFLFKFQPKLKLLGITATPQRLDKEDISEIFTELAYSISMFELIDQGYLMPITGYVVNTSISLDNVAVDRSGDYDEKELALAVDCPRRNQLVADSYFKLASDRKTIIFAVNVKHAENLTHELNRKFIEKGMGMQAAVIHGAMKKEDRRRVLADFNENKYKVLLNCSVLTEGFDQPDISCVIVARPTKSSSLYSQMVGRGLRLHNSKKDCLVIDLVDMAKQAKASQNINQLFDLPPNLDINGKDVNTLRKTVTELKQHHPNLAWKVGQVITRESLEEILQPTTLFQIAKNVELAEANVPHAWFQVGRDRYALALADQNWLVLEKTPLGNYVVRVHGNEIHQVKGTNGLEAAMLETTTIIEKLFPGSLRFSLKPDTAQEREPPTKPQLTLLHQQFGVGVKDLNMIKTKAQASLMISRLSVCRQLCELEGKFSSGKYFGYSFALIYFFDPQYISQECKNHAGVQNALTPISKTLDWLEKAKPTLWGNITKTHSKAELVQMSADRPAQFHTLIRDYLKSDIEFAVLDSHWAKGAFKTPR
jgi:superfamily II DNA or RNA helicase